MHAREQSRVGVMALIEIRRCRTGACDLFGRRVDQVVGQPARRIGERCLIKIAPTAVMVLDHVEHHLAGLDRRKSIIAKRPRELAGETGVLIHPYREAGNAFARTLQNHAWSPWPSGPSRNEQMIYGLTELHRYHLIDRLTETQAYRFSVKSPRRTPRALMDIGVAHP